MSRNQFSLRARLLLVASLVLLVFLGLMGAVLDQAFRRSAEEGVSERLLLHIYGLLAVTEEYSGELALPDALQEPDFNRLGTGLYGLVIDRNGKELWRSPSALDLALPPPSKVSLYTGTLAGTPAFGRTFNDQGEPLFFLSYRVLWQGGGNVTTPYIFVVLQTLDTYRGEVSGFRNNLWGWLVGVVILLIVVQALVMNWGLSPLQRLEIDLKQIEDGERDYLEGDYPSEIDGVTRNLNILLASERAQREKYRTTLGDLAHSLKTPLAILKGAASSLSYSGSDTNEVRVTIEEQVDRMDDIVSYQLEKAVTRDSQLIRKAIDVAPVLESLAAAMRQVYQSKAIQLETRADGAAFFGDERDLMELMGNLIDNACKYGVGTVQVVVTGNDGPGLTIVVDDDGPGIGAGDRDRVLARGTRLDSREKGHGIGLAIAAEIVRRYGGEIAIGESAIGGARVTVSLP